MTCLCSENTRATRIFFCGHLVFLYRDLKDKINMRKSVSLAQDNETRPCAGMLRMCVVAKLCFFSLFFFFYRPLTSVFIMYLSFVI